MVEGMTYHNAVTYVHMILHQLLRAGDVVVDATAGNGHDARCMLELVGPQGTLYAFDVQAEAIAATRSAIGDLPGTVNLIHAGHEGMADHITVADHGCVRAVTFNLGYLPGGDHTQTTTVNSTLAAVRSAMSVIAVHGMITIVCYRHPEGELELQALRELAVELDQQMWVLTETTFSNQRGKPPLVLTIVRQS
jgi:hypothetical protein